MRDGLRNIVPFLIEEHVNALGANGLHNIAALAREKLVADFEEAEIGLQQPHVGQGFVGAIHIQGKNQFVGHRGGHVRVEE